MKAWIMHVWIAGFALALMACGGEEDPENLCVPGVAQPCPCEGVIQECKPDGSGFTSCDCSASEGEENASEEEEAGGEENEVDATFFPEKREARKKSWMHPLLRKKTVPKPTEWRHLQKTLLRRNQTGKKSRSLHPQEARDVVFPRNFPPGNSTEIDAGPDGDGTRSYWLSLPAGYDPSVPHDLIVGYPGRDYYGQPMQNYLNLESPGKAEIFVYPDPLVREFAGWGTYAGWLLGPNAAPANGMADLAFTETLLNHLESSLCIDTDRVFITGHSWGGDMAHVVACFLGDRVAAAAPAAANQPYWFTTGGGWVECAGTPAVWTFFGIADDAFGNGQAYPGDFGDQCRDFWLDNRQCDGVDSYTELPWGEPGDCVEYTGCSSPVRYCLYGPATGHQIPPYFSGAIMEFFRGYTGP